MPVAANIYREGQKSNNGLKLKTAKHCIFCSRSSLLSTDSVRPSIRPFVFDHCYLTFPFHSTLHGNHHILHIAQRSMFNVDGLDFLSLARHKETSGTPAEIGFEVGRIGCVT